MVHTQQQLYVTALALLSGVQLTFGHEPGHPPANMAVPKTVGFNSTSESKTLSPQSYFALAEHGNLMLAHIIIMTVAWLFLLPIAVMLSVARSRHTSAVQIVFLGLHGTGLLLGTIYSRKTPNLYENNSHPKLGWMLTMAMVLQCALGLLKRFADGRIPQHTTEERTAFLPMSSDALLQQQQPMQPIQTPYGYRYSDDSGHFSASESSRNASISSMQDHNEEELQTKLHEYEDAHPNTHPDPTEKQGLLDNAVGQRIAARVSLKLSRRLLKGVGIVYDTIDCIGLPLGFIAIGSGAVVYGGVFRGDNIFNGLAHSVKGGIFFWYGLLTLGRWMGCFAELGWAWNVKPPLGAISARKARLPSAEFTESFVIFLYGATNVWLEHLAAWGDAWSAQDFEHVSISIMFFGGGLAGMLVESKTVRNFLNTSILDSFAAYQSQATGELAKPPKTYAFSMNPFPGLIILLLGLMMSSHHQASAVATLVHKQWGMLFVGFALSRAITYILMYISPPSSYLPSRPPSELISSFCLISGGLIFIASNKDTVSAMEHHNLHAMFPFTVTMGFTAFLMAWVIIVLAIKGWAARRT